MHAVMAQRLSQDGRDLIQRLSTDSQRLGSIDVEGLNYSRRSFDSIHSDRSLKDTMSMAGARSRQQTFPLEDADSAPADTKNSQEEAHVALNDDKKEPEKVKAGKDIKFVSFREFFMYADKWDYVLMAVGTISALIAGTGLPLYAIFLGRVLNALVVVQENPDELFGVAKWALALLGLGVATGLGAMLYTSCWIITGNRQVQRLRLKYVNAILQQDIEYFDTAVTPGTITTSIVADTQLVQTAIGEKIGGLLEGFSCFALGLVLAFSKSWKVSLVGIAGVPPIFGAGAFGAVAALKVAKRAPELYEPAGIVVEQTLSQIRTVYSFVGESRAVQWYTRGLESSSKIAYKGATLKGFSFGLTWTMVFFSFALTFWYGAGLVRSGELSPGDLVSVIFAVILACIKIGLVVPKVEEIMRGLIAAYKLQKVIKRTPKINVGSSKKNFESVTLKLVEGTLEFQNVHFHYPSRPEANIFDNLNLVIPSRKSMAIVGESGSGKSTVISLIERFYDPIKGSVLLDGHDIKTMDVKWLRDQIGLVNQEPALFATTIKENILYGRSQATIEEIELAAKAANAHEFITKLPQGYETQVGERGVQLSGGQKQRVAITRAMLKDPKILLLDEATSALDSNSEKLIQQALDRLMIGQTTIIVAHRLSTIFHCHAIVVLRDGKILEQGSHEVLMTKGDDGAYAQLVRMQNVEQDSRDLNYQLHDPLLAPNSPHKTLEADHLYDEQTQANLTQNSDGLIDNHNEKGDEEAQGVRGKRGKSSQSKKPNYWSFGDKSTSNYWGILKMTKGDLFYWIWGVLGSMGSGAIMPFLGFGLGHQLGVIGESNLAKQKHDINLFSWVLVIIGIIGPMVCTMQYGSLEVVGARLSTRIRSMILTALLRNEVSWYDKEENSSVALSARLAGPIGDVKYAVTDLCGLIVKDLTSVVITFIYGFIFAWEEAMVLVALYPVLCFSIYFQNLSEEGFGGDVHLANERACKVASQGVSNIRTVAAFNAESKITNLFANELKAPSQLAIKRGAVGGVFYGAAYFAQFSSYALGFWSIGKLVSLNRYTMGELLPVYSIGVWSTVSVIDSLVVIPNIIKSAIGLNYVYGVLNRQTMIVPDESTGITLKSEIKSCHGEIELQNVCFAYPSRPTIQVFKNMNLKVASCNSLALVGTSGSGKSTIISLIERYYDPQSGVILIDGQDLKSYNLRSLRLHMALVQQEPTLFSTTIYENIIYGRQGASEGEVIEAAKAANAHGFISSLPDGYNTQVGEKGAALSGGQKQRVAIARAVLKNPAILLLDEATSALDVDSEKVVQDALDKLIRRRTTIIVTHRLTTIRNVDNIAVIQDGVIVEQGTHDELIQKEFSEGAYRSLVHLQDQAH